MRILLVEDDADLAQFIRKGLKEEYYAVDVAVDGEAGLALALDTPYDLVILDVMLPKLDGLTLCRRIRDKGITTPVLACRVVADQRLPRNSGTGGGVGLIDPTVLQ